MFCLSLICVLFLMLLVSLGGLLLIAPSVFYCGYKFCILFHMLFVSLDIVYYWLPLWFSLTVICYVSCCLCYLCHWILYNYGPRDNFWYSPIQKAVTVLLYRTNSWNILFNIWIVEVLLNDQEFCFLLIGLNSIFSTLPRVQWAYLACSEYTSRAVSTPRVRYSRACVNFCLLSIRCFNVVQPETRFHFQSANQIARKGQNFQKFQNFKILQSLKNFI